MDKKDNTGAHTSVTLKNALRTSPPKNNPNMSDAEREMKFQGEKG